MFLNQHAPNRLSSLGDDRRHQMVRAVLGILQSNFSYVFRNLTQNKNVAVHCQLEEKPLPFLSTSRLKYQQNQVQTTGYPTSN